MSAPSFMSLANASNKNSVVLSALRKINIGKTPEKISPFELARLDHNTSGILSYSDIMDLTGYSIINQNTIININNMVDELLYKHSSFAYKIFPIYKIEKPSADLGANKKIEFTLLQQLKVLKRLLEFSKKNNNNSKENPIYPNPLLILNGSLRLTNLSFDSWEQDYGNHNDAIKAYSLLQHHFKSVNNKQNKTPLQIVKEIICNLDNNNQKQENNIIAPFININLTIINKKSSNPLWLSGNEINWQKIADKDSIDIVAHTEEIISAAPDLQNLGPKDKQAFIRYLHTIRATLISEKFSPSTENDPQKIAFLNLSQKQIESIISNLIEREIDFDSDWQTYAKYQKSNSIANSVLYMEDINMIYSEKEYNLVRATLNMDINTLSPLNFARIFIRLKNFSDGGVKGTRNNNNYPQSLPINGYSDAINKYEADVMLHSENGLWQQFYGGETLTFNDNLPSDRLNTNDIMSSYNNGTIIDILLEDEEAAKIYGKPDIFKKAKGNFNNNQQALETKFDSISSATTKQKKIRISSYLKRYKSNNSNYNLTININQLDDKQINLLYKYTLLGEFIDEKIWISASSTPLIFGLLGIGGDCNTLTSMVIAHISALKDPQLTENITLLSYPTHAMLMFDIPKFNNTGEKIEITRFIKDINNKKGFQSANYANLNYGATSPLHLWGIVRMNAEDIKTHSHNYSYSKIDED